MVQCRDAYNVIPPSTADDALVVEGIINANGRTKIVLSRTTRLSDKRIAPEIGAFLFVEGENDGSVFPLFEGLPGEYISDEHVLEANNRYRLKITTHDNRQYATDFKGYIITPVIDSITWKRENGGVQMYVNAHNDAGGSTYFKYDWEETWEFHSAFRTTLYFKQVPPGPTGNIWELAYFDSVNQSVNESLFRCYNNRSSTSIDIVSTANLVSNVVYSPIRFVPDGSIEMGVMYSINVNQYALSAEAFEFFSRMKKNTESLGSIFDAQPSEISGNVKCITDPAELVIGYVDVSTSESKRIFISRDELPDWGYEFRCDKFGETSEEYPYPNNPDIFPRIIERGLTPTVPAKTFFTAIITFYVEKIDCVDCTKRGSNVKPSFWPI
jgi:hypothetical protein